MNKPDAVPCELLPWDTEFFGCRIARVRGEAMSQDQAAQIDEWCRSNKIRALYFLARADDPATIQTAEQHGFGLVDIRMIFGQELPDSPVQTDTTGNLNLRPFQPGDLPGLQTLARASHRETRFFSDRNFSRQRAEDLYSTWITLEAQGRAQTVLVAAADNQPVGYISCHLDSARSEGQIGLVGVSAEVRGQGIGKNLVQTALNWFRAQGARHVTVVTQGNNQAAQRLYQRCGFLSRDVRLWYHKWYPSSDQPA